MKFNTKTLKDYQTAIHTLTHNREKLFDYIYTKSVILNKDVKLTDICDATHPFQQIIVPDKIVNPKQFTFDDYPLAQNQQAFADDHPYDYLVTFDVNSFLESDTKHKIYEAIRSTLLVKQCQSRLANNWRQLAGVLLACDMKSKRTGQPNIFRYFVQSVLTQLTSEDNISRRDFPFFENKNELKFNQVKVVSIFPLLVYMLSHVGFRYAVGTFNTYEVYVAINVFLDMAQVAYQDTKLALKSTGRNWLVQSMSKLGKIKVPYWGVYGILRGEKEKNVSEPPYVTKSFVGLAQERKDKLPPLLNSYIDNIALKANSLTKVLKCYAATRSMTNDGTYYATATDLSWNKAIRPMLVSQVIEAPEVLERTEEYITDFKFKDGFANDVVNYLSLYIDDVVQRLTNVNPDTELIAFMTMSSAGVKVTHTEKKDVSETLARVLNKRLVRLAKDSHKYRDMKSLIEDFSLAIILVERTQLDRRQRGISGLNNARLLCSFPAYLIAKATYPKFIAAAQGKQSGNALDIFDMLLWTIQDDVLLSSIDIKGMDASIQTILRDIVTAFNVKVARQLTQKNFAAFTSSTEQVTDVKTGRVSTKNITALEKAILFDKQNTQSSATYESKTFGKVTNREGTFSSGRADTSSHHTLLLGATLKTSQINQSPKVGSSRASINTMGDDVYVVYSGSTHRMILNIEHDAECIAKLGLATESELSVSTLVFLQMQATAGCFVGYDDRISPFTKEHSSEYISSLQTVQELRALMDDLVWRVTDTIGLKEVQFTIACLTALRFTLSLTKDIYDEICALFERFLKIDRRPVNANYKYTRLVVIYIPVCWLFMYKGGELPAIPFERLDGSYTCDESIHTPRGHIKRRLLYDVSNIKEMIESDHINLNKNLLSEYGFEGAQFLINLNIVGLEYETKENDVDKAEIVEMTRKLESYSNVDAFNRSRAAAEALKKAFEIDLPEDIVYGEQLQRKIYAVMRELDMTESVRRTFSSGLLTTVKEMSKLINQFKPSKEDIKYVYYLVEDESLIDITTAHVAARFPITANLNAGSESMCAMAYLGMLDQRIGAYQIEANSVHGKYGKFKYDDLLFNEAVSIYQSKRTAMNLFYEAINYTKSQARRLERAIRYYLANNDLQINSSTTPRNLFMINPQPNNVPKIMVEDTIVGVSQKRVFLYGLIHHEILRVCRDLSFGRIKLVMHSVLRRNFNKVSPKLVLA
ncbi:RNA dependent RNA polymerase [Biston robustus cypovirus]|nr:RNA dependent RNA polymerase [Biston robustus cypovirus]